MQSTLSVRPLLQERRLVSADIYGRRNHIFLISFGLHETCVPGLKAVLLCTTEALLTIVTDIPDWFDASTITYLPARNAWTEFGDNAGSL
jgi:hypothetical protein